MKTFLCITLAALLALLPLFGCSPLHPKEPEQTPVPEGGYIRQSYDIQGLVFADGGARVYGLVLNTGTLDIAYIGFNVELCDSRGNMLYEQRCDIVLYEAVVPGDSYPFNCVFEEIFVEDEAAIYYVRIGDFLWET